MMRPYTGAVSRQNETKYDLLRAPRESLLVFCLSSDYQYPVMNISYSDICGTVERPNSTPSNNLDCPNYRNYGISWYFVSFESKGKVIYLLYLSGPLKFKGQICLLWTQTFMLEFQNITGVMVIDLIKNKQKLSLNFYDQITHWGC